jgi:hypothetical protein
MAMVWRGECVNRGMRRLGFDFDWRVLPFLMMALILAAAGAAGAERSTQPGLDLRALAGPLQELTPAEGKVVDEAIGLIRQKRHASALAELSGLIVSNPKNSALRILRAYVLLELGNVTGALDEARAGEGLGVRSAYRCWFLAQVAYLAGNVPLCRREIGHVGGDRSYGPAAEKLRRRLEAEGK